MLDCILKMFENTHLCHTSFCFILENAMSVPVININPNTGRMKVFGKARMKGIKSKDFVHWRYAFFSWVWKDI